MKYYNTATATMTSGGASTTSTASNVMTTGQSTVGGGGTGSGTSLTLVKRATLTDANFNGVTDLGDQISWTFELHNVSTVSLSSIAVSDPVAGVVSCSTTTLAPNASVTCTAAAHAISQADVDAGVVRNIATATGQDPGGTTISSNESSTNTQVSQSSGLTLVKTASVDQGADGVTNLGDTVTWNFAVRNTGTVTLHGLAVTDPTAAPVSCPVTTLAPNATTTCTATHTIDQTDVNAGSINNTATATSLDGNNNPVSSNTSTTNTTITQTSGLSLVKTASVAQGTDNTTNLGDTITWNFQVTNTGTVTVDEITVSDPIAGVVSCPQTTLGPGGSMTCSSPAHTITQTDVDAGAVHNTATCTGQDPSNSTVTSQPSATTTKIEDQLTGLSIKKIALVKDTDGGAENNVALDDEITTSSETPAASPVANASYSRVLAYTGALGIAAAALVALGLALAGGTLTRFSKRSTGTDRQ